jgi:multidrug resistance efflux pump
LLCKVALGKDVRAQAAKDLAMRKVALEKARIERERLARLRQPGAIAQDDLDGCELMRLRRSLP